MTHLDHDDGLTDPASRWDDDAAADHAYELELDRILGITP